MTSFNVQVVCCDYRRVKTTNIQNFFPQPLPLGLQGNILPQIDIEKGNIEKYNNQLPVWIKGAAKLLSSGDENQDWIALSKLMGKHIKRLLFCLFCTKGSDLKKA